MTPFLPESVDTLGVFETCRVSKGKILHLEEHLNRLRSSLKTLGLTDWEEETQRQRLIQVAKGMKEGYLRILVRRYGEPILHTQTKLPYPKDWKKKGIAVRTVPTRWPAGETGWAQVKGSDRLAAILSRMDAPDSFEVLRLGPHGFLTEGTVSNLFFVKKKVLYTPPRWLGVLEGVTRSGVIQAAHRIRIEVKEVPFSRHDLFNAEEAFLTNVLMGILPIRQVDGRNIGTVVPGPITRRLTQMIKP